MESKKKKTSHSLRIILENQNLYTKRTLACIYILVPYKVVDTVQTCLIFYSFRPKCKSFLTVEGLYYIYYASRCIIIYVNKNKNGL